MKKINKILLVFLSTITLLFCLTGCSMEPVGEQFSAEQNVEGGSSSNVSGKTSYEALFYTNDGELYSIVEGKNFSFTPNKVKEYGYNSEGHWESYYVTSSVLTVQIDGSFIESCGNTIILKENNIKYTPVEEILASLEESHLENNNPNKDAPSLSVDDKENNDGLISGYQSYWNLKYWWSDIKERGQGGAKMIVIQSQNGDNIGVLTGNDVTWRVSEDLPKTTVLTIDGQDVLIHRANFQIIDAKLLESNQ